MYNCNNGRIVALKTFKTATFGLVNGQSDC